VLLRAIVYIVSHILVLNPGAGRSICGCCCLGWVKSASSVPTQALDAHGRDRP